MTHNNRNAANIQDFTDSQFRQYDCRDQHHKDNNTPISTFTITIVVSHREKSIIFVIKKCKSESNSKLLARLP